MFHRLVITLSLLALLLSNFAFAKAELQFGATPAWVKTVPANTQTPNSREINDGYFLRLFEQEYNVATKQIYQHTIREIISEAGIQSAANLSINFNPSYELLSIHQVTVWRDGKPTNRLDKAAIKTVANEEDLSRFIYNGNYTAYLILNDIRIGDKIEYSYTLTGENPIFDNKFFTSLVLQGSDPIAQMHYCIIAPASRKLNFKYYNEAQAPVQQVAGGDMVYEWNLENLKGLDVSDNIPSWYIAYPFIQISEFKDWAEVAQWGHNINKPTEKPGGALGKRVKEIADNYKDNKQGLLRALTDMVQTEIRYMGVEIGPYSHRANNPEKVYEQRYGDCKDKSLLLVSALLSVGIPAEMALVSTASEGHVIERIPSPTAFNHAIVVAHVDDKEVWIDPTMSYQGSTGADIYCPNYGNALVLGAGKTDLSPIPETNNGTIHYTEQYEASDVTSPVTLTVITTYSGGMADKIRASYANQSNVDLEKNFLNYYSNFYSKIERADTLVIADDKASNVLETTEKYIITDFFEFDSANQNYPVSFYARMIKNILPSVDNKKKYPIATSYPYELHHSIRVKIPLNWNIDFQTETIDRSSYTFKYRVSVDNDVFALDHDFKFNKDHIAPDDIVQYDKDSKRMLNDLLSYSFTYTPGAGKTHTGIKYSAILVMLAIIAGAVYLGNKVYKTPTARYAHLHPSPRIMGGWLILPVLAMIVTPIQLGYYLINTGYLNEAIWHAYDHKTISTTFKLLLWMELVINTTIMCYAIFCLILMYHKRDILPKHIIRLYVGILVGVMVDNVLTGILLPDIKQDYKEVSRSLISVCIWVPYFLKSVRVKETFTVPYGDYLPYTPTNDQTDDIGNATDADVADNRENSNQSNDTSTEHDKYMPKQPDNSGQETV